MERSMIAIHDAIGVADAASAWVLWEREGAAVGPGKRKRYVCV